MVLVMLVLADDKGISPLAADGGAVVVAVVVVVVAAVAAAASSFRAHRPKQHPTILSQIGRNMWCNTTKGHIRAGSRINTTGCRAIRKMFCSKTGFAQAGTSRDMRMRSSTRAPQV